MTKKKNKTVEKIVKKTVEKKVVKKEVKGKVKQESVMIDGERKIKHTHPDGTVRIYGL